VELCFTIALKRGTDQSAKVDFPLAIASEVSGSRKNLFCRLISMRMRWLENISYKKTFSHAQETKKSLKRLDLRLKKCYNGSTNEKAGGFGSRLFVCKTSL